MTKATAIVTAMLLTLGLLISTPVWASELLQNGSFEIIDDNSWDCDDNCTGRDYIYYVVAGGDIAFDGVNYLYLFHEAGIYQDVIIPNDAVALSLWYDNQPDDEVPEDGSFTVSLLDPTTSEVYTSETFSEPADDIWLNASVAIPSSLQGQTVRVSLSNDTGFNRIDYTEFTTEADAIEELQQNYATVKLHVLSAIGKAVKDAKVFVKKSSNKLDLIDLTTTATVKHVTTNKKGRTHQFMIARELSEGDTLKLCVKKKTVTECANISPETGVSTSFDFSFESKKVK